MRILMIFQTWKYLGGGDTSMMSLAYGLSTHHHVTIAYDNPHLLECSGDSSPITPHHTAPHNDSSHGIDLFALPVVALSCKGSAALSRYLQTRSLNRLVLTRTFDVIIGYLTRSAHSAVQCGKRLSIPSVVFHFETPHWLEQQLATQWSPDKKLTRLWEQARHDYASCDMLIANSQLAADWSEKWCSRPSDGVVYPGIEIQSQNHQDILNRYGVLPKQYLVVVSRLVANKGIEQLIQAMEHSGYPMPLVIIGDGPLYQMTTHTQIKWVGRIDNQHRDTLIASAHTMIFPSLFEGFGMPPGEALWEGVPCIASDLPILREVYKDYLIYTPPGDSRALAQHITNIIHDDTKARLLAKKGKAFVRSHYTWKKATQQANRLLAKVTKIGHL